MAARGPNLARHAPFCGPHHIGFVFALGLLELPFLYVIAELHNFYIITTASFSHKVNFLVVSLNDVIFCKNSG